MYANMQLFDWAVLTTLCWQQVLQSFTTHLYLQKKRSWRFIDKGASPWMEMSEWKGYEKLFKIITVLLLRFMYFFHLDKEP